MNANSSMNSNSNVTPFAGTVNPLTIEDFNVWLEAQGRAGRLNPTTARLCMNAVGQLTQVLQPDEPRDPRSILENIEDITTRWLRLNPTNDPGTARTYRQRAANVLGAYLRFQADPPAFKWDTKPPRQKSDGDAPKRSSKAKASQAHVAPEPTTPQPPAPAAPPRSDLRAYPLGQGRSFAYDLNNAGALTMRDVRRIACHLLTLAEDFDPDARVGMAFVHTDSNEIVRE